MSVQKFELDPLQQVSFDAKALVSLEGYYQAQCPRHAEMLGLRDEELVGRPLEFVIGAELARGVREAVSGQLFRGEGQSFLHQHLPFNIDRAARSSRNKCGSPSISACRGHWA